MLLKAKEAGKVARPSVVETLAEGSKTLGPSSLVSANSMEAKLFDVLLNDLNDVGERRKSRDHDFCASARDVDEPFERSCVRRFAVRGSCERSGGSSLGSMLSNPTDGRFKSSLTSLVVKATCG